MISFCNVFPLGLALGIYDYDNEKFGWINSDSTSKNILGIDGISKSNKKYFVVTQLKEGGISGLSIFNRDLQLEKNYDFIETNDAHSIIAYGIGFLVADTGKNRIVHITFDDDSKKITETEFWRYNDDGKDTVHVNSMAMMGNKIFVSVFGTKPSNDWQEAKSGKIIDTSTNKVISDNLHHPHSLTAIDETLYWLESGTGIIHKYSEKRGHEIFLKIGGYLRGITSDKKYLFVASSGKRRTSRSTGVPNSTLSNSSNESRSWIYRINKKNKKFERKELTAYGVEIYDLLLLENKHDLSKYENPITHRLWKFEDVCFNPDVNSRYIDYHFRLIIREYVNNAQWDKALSHIEQILEKAEDAEMEYLLAFILQSKKQNSEKALEYYTRALKHGFSEFWVRYNRGLLYLTLGNIDLATIDLKRALELNPDDKTTLQLLNNLKNDNLSRPDPIL